MPAGFGKKRMVALSRVPAGGQDMAGLFEGVAARTFAPLLLRAALAAVFIFHGLEKVKPEFNYGAHWAGDAQSAPVQMLVAWGELLGGVALALGILTRWAAIGLIIIQIGAIVTVTGEKGFGLIHGASEYKGGYEYNFVLILVTAALAILGPGTFSLDRVIRVKSRGPAKY
jgi:putative oxidoreductase